MSSVPVHWGVIVVYVFELLKLNFFSYLLLIFLVLIILIKKVILRGTFFTDIVDVSMLKIKIVTNVLKKKKGTGKMN